MARLLAALAAGLALVGGTAAVVRSAPPDPVATFRMLANAASSGDEHGMWALLTEASRRRIGRARFHTVVAPALEQSLGLLNKGHTGISVSEQAAPGWWLVAIVGQTPTQVNQGLEAFEAYAAPLRLEDGGWRLEIESPIRIRPVSPRAHAKLDPSGAVPRRTPMAAAFAAAAPLETTALWLDNKPLPAKASGTPTKRLLAGRSAVPLGTGLHAVVAFAAAGGTATALAWPFTVIGG